MNSVHLIGNLGADPNLRSTESGTAVCNFNLAVDRVYYRNTQGGQREKVKTTDWIPVVVWGAQAENCNKYLQTGSKVAITGRISQRSYEDAEGKRRYAFEVVADDVQFLNKIKSNQTAVVEAPA